MRSTRCLAVMLLEGVGGAVDTGSNGQWPGDVVRIVEEGSLGKRGGKSFRAGKGLGHGG